MGGKSSSKSRTTETRLSNIQADILKKREEQYQQFFFPELLADLEKTTGGIDSAFVAGQGVSLAKAQAAARTGFQRTLAQRGVHGGGGVGLLARSRMRGDQAMQRAQFLSSAQQRNQQLRMGLFQLGLGKSPTPTQAAPMGTKSSSKSFTISNPAAPAG